MRSRDTHMNVLYSLAASLKMQHFDDEEKFIETYGEEIHEKFFGIAPIIEAFLRDYNDICERINTDRYKKRNT